MLACLPLRAMCLFASGWLGPRRHFHGDWAVKRVERQRERANKGEENKSEDWRKAKATLGTSALRNTVILLLTCSYGGRISQEMTWACSHVSFILLDGHNKADWFASPPKDTNNVLKQSIFLIRLDRNKALLAHETHTITIQVTTYLLLSALTLTEYSKQTSPLTDSMSVPIIAHSSSRSTPCWFCNTVVSLGHMSTKLNMIVSALSPVRSWSPNRNQRPRQALGVCGGMRSGLNFNKPQHTNCIKHSGTMRGLYLAPH